MISTIMVNVPAAPLYRSFAEGVQAICDDARGRPATTDTLRALEARLDYLAADAVRSGELRNETSPRAQLMILTFGGGIEIGLIWSEKPVLKESPW